MNIGSWIFTAGLHAGVAKHVGKGARDYTLADETATPVICIGVIPWGVVWKRENLILV